MVVVVVGVCARVRCLEERDRYLEQVSDTAGNLHSAPASWEKAESMGLVNFKTVLKPGYGYMGWSPRMMEVRQWGSGGPVLRCQRRPKPV